MNVCELKLVENWISNCTGNGFYRANTGQKITHNDTFSNALTRITECIWTAQPTDAPQQTRATHQCKLVALSPPPLPLESRRSTFFILQKHIFCILHISCPKEICFNLDCMLCHAVKFRSDDRHFQVSERATIQTCMWAASMACDGKFHI